MAETSLRFWAAAAVAACLAISSPGASRVVEGRVGADLKVHEWGTFTSVAGPDGNAVSWLALTGSTNLPDFVEHLRDEGFKCGLGGTVRMETPVIYFYSPHETNVSVKVTFPEGLITEWYPRASVVAPAVIRPDNLRGGSIEWNAVRLLPGSHPTLSAGDNGNHYFAARNTAAAPLRVRTSHGDQDEKFLFYRGVASAALPISAQLAPDGKLLVRSLAADPIPAAMLIESRDGKLGYRMAAGLRGQSTMEPPALSAHRESMLADLHRTLVAQGLYDDEARAMIATWRDSWFEEGSRLLYILPAASVDVLLPLTINPAPAESTRVFVGRMELVSPATETAVKRAFAAHDQPELDKYSRFLEPIVMSMLARGQSDPARTRSLRAALTSVYAHACRSPWSVTR